MRRLTFRRGRPGRSARGVRHRQQIPGRHLTADDAHIRRGLDPDPHGVALNANDRDVDFSPTWIRSCVLRVRTNM